MNKKEISEEIRKLKDEIDSVYSEANEVRYKFIREKEHLLDEKRNRIKELRILLESKKRPELEIPKHIQEWFRKATSGVDWGYGGIKIIYISPKQKYVIVTNKGGTSGQGTAMGTGGYYYSKSSHWILKVDESTSYSHSAYSNKVGNIEFEGRLTKDKKQEMINKILELEKGGNFTPNGVVELSFSVPSPSARQ